MLLRWSSPLVRVGSAVAFVLVLASCTPGGQFDPTQIFNSDVFDSKKKLPGQREPLFPNGVPGAETGVPPDLVKGYKPPPDQDADTGAAPDGAAADTGAPPPAPRAEAKPKPKPKPKLARAPTSQDSAFDRKPPTRIDVGPAPKGGPAAAAQPSAAQPAAANAQSVWPAPPPTAQQSAAPSQSIWPAPPPTAPQAAPSGQSIWPNPPATGPTQ